MSDVAAALRAKALAHGTRPRPLHLILDDTLREEHAQLTNRLRLLQAEREKMAADGNLPQTAEEPPELDSLADTPTDATAATGMVAEIDRLIDSLRKAITEVEDEAADKGETLVTWWRRLAPAEYRAISQACDREARKQVEKAEKAGDTTTRTWSAIFGELLGDRLAERCWKGATTPEGDEVELSLDDLRDSVLSYGESARLYDFLVELQTAQGAITPFVHRSSGQAATS